MKLNYRNVGYAILRATIGFIFLVYGISKFLLGPVKFAEGLRQEFASTFLPQPMVYGFGLLLPFLEFGLGTLLVLGLFTRFALAITGLLLISLTAGVALRGQGDVVAHNLIYAAIVFLLMYHSDDNGICLDGLFRAQS
jgi:thiosulfate dehydrogenase (quinone) large subunit